MEVSAAIYALNYLQSFNLKLLDTAEFVILSDSMYLIKTMTQGWARNKNRDLWNRLDKLVEGRKISFRHVRAHSGNPQNERADQIAHSEALSVSGGEA